MVCRLTTPLPAAQPELLWEPQVQHEHKFLQNFNEQTTAELRPKGLNSISHAPAYILPTKG